jgi:hypothetical protein
LGQTGKAVILPHTTFITDFSARYKTLINSYVGVYERDGLVQYPINGLPFYSYANDDRDAFRYITSNFIHQGLCRNVDVERAFGVSEDSVTRALKKFETKGEAGFFPCYGHYTF